MRQETSQPSWVCFADTLATRPTLPSLEGCMAWVEELCRCVEDSHKRNRRWGWLAPEHLYVLSLSPKEHFFQIRHTLSVNEGADVLANMNSAYVAPEITITGATLASDVFSVAALSYAMLSNHSLQVLYVPAMGRTPVEQAQRQPLTKVLQQAMHPMAAQRFTDIPSFSKALKDAYTDTQLREQGLPVEELFSEDKLSTPPPLRVLHTSTPPPLPSHRFDTPPRLPSLNELPPTSSLSAEDTTSSEEQAD